MASWSDLDRELDRWASQGLEASLWWRDDDAAELTPEVERLIGLAASAGVSVHLAVIPARLTDELAPVLKAPQVRVLQHGFAHTNYAPKGEGSWELGRHRPRGEVVSQLQKGFALLAAAFGEQFLPVLVPPWTRIDPGLVPCLPGLGFRALSMEGARRAIYIAPGFLAINAHCDPIKWKGGPRFTGTERALDEIVGHLAARRECRADPAEATGLCTHHLAHDLEVWSFLEALLERTVAHPGARWIGLEAELPVKVAPC